MRDPGDEGLYEAERLWGVRSPADLLLKRIKDILILDMGGYYNYYYDYDVVVVAVA